MQRVVYVLLVFSVLLNVVLIVQRLRPVPAIATVDISSNVHSPDTTITSMSNEVPKEPGMIKPFDPDLLSRRQFDWSTVESEDYKKYIANLREIGCPPETIRDIVSEDLRKNHKRREWEIIRKATPTDYWSPSFGLSVRLESNELSSLQELGRQYQWSHKELLGSAPDIDHEDQRDKIRKEVLATFGDLDWEKSEALTSIKSELYADLRQLPSTAHDQLVKKSEESMAQLLSEEEQRLRLLRWFLDIFSGLTGV
jgi:hypothetical protein